MQSSIDSGLEQSPATANATSVDTKRLTRAYIVALSFVALLTFTGQMIVQRSLSLLEGDTAAVNVAGRQRMLSQRIARLLLDLETPHSDSQQLQLQQQLKESLSQWQTSHRLFSDPETALGTLIERSTNAREKFKELGLYFDELATTANDRLNSDVGSGGLALAASARVSYLSDQFLAGMDQVVMCLDDESRQRVMRVRWIESVLMLATLMVLACEGWLIFRPAVSQLRRNLEQQQLLSQQLVDSKEQAERANRAKTDFLARVSHELRTPLHAISGMLALVRKSKLTRLQRQRISLAGRSSTRLKRLVDDLLDVSTAEAAAQWQLRMRPTNVRRLVRRTVDLMRPLARRKDIALDCALRCSRVYARIDPFRLQQVLVNLLQNAITYTDQGLVTCSLHVEELDSQEWLVIEARDTGCGIAPEDQSRIFEAFVRLQDRVITLDSGAQLGLGLPIAAALTQSMGGQISLTSELGFGSSFIIRLPLTRCSPPPVKKRQQLQTNQSSIDATVLSRSEENIPLLIVDDILENREVLKGYASLLGYTCVMASSVVAAEQLLDEHAFRIALVDYHLGADNASALLRRLKLLECRIFLVTADVNVTPQTLPDDIFVEQVLYKPLAYHEFCQLFSPSSGVTSAALPSDPFAELRTRLQRTFLERFPAELERLKVAIDQRDLEDFHLTAHRLHGSAATVGLASLAALFSQLEAQDDWPQRSAVCVNIASSIAHPFELKVVP